MRIAYRITILVSLQIALIITSFLAIVYFESQTALAGNIVNVAGKNRALTSMVLVELNYKIFYSQASSGVIASLEDLSENILVLKRGDDTSQIRTLPLSPHFEEDWNLIMEKFSQYKVEIDMIQTQGKSDHATIEQAGQTADELIALSDMLTEKLGRDVDTLSSQLIVLQLSLGTVNVAVHILMIILIWRIFDKYAKQQAKRERLATIGEFAASMAHNLRNPLGAIQFSSDRIRGRGEREEIRLDATARIDRCIRRMTHQIEDVMNHVRTAPLALSDRSVREILAHSVELVEIPENIELRLPKNDTAILCDGEKLEVVFVNLLRNAVQAIGSNEGSIKIRLSEDADGIRLEFENSGPQIPESDIAHIFEPLYTTKMEGTGLGLASCQNIIVKHGGKISVSNNPVIFTTYLPMDPEGT